MKKWLLTLLVIIGILLMASFIFFPREKKGSDTEKFNCNINSLNRFIMNQDNWAKWWPGKVEHNVASGKNIFSYNGYHYTIIEKRYNSFVMQTKGNNLDLNSSVFFIPVSIDTIQAEWKYSLQTTSNPVYKMNLYWQSKKIDKNIAGILASMKAFLDNPDKVYGMHIDQVIVKDTILVTTNFKSGEYPSTETIYNYINGIKDYISSHNARETNSPMLHVLEDSGRFNIQVAIPVNQVIEGDNTYFVKRMVPGKILVAGVRGGVYTANHALKEMGFYLIDNHLSSPAIPFESLITNRMQEHDTTKWITKIYYPIF